MTTPFLISIELTVVVEIFSIYTPTLNSTGFICISIINNLLHLIFDSIDFILINGRKGTFKTIQYLV